ncbi:MAG: putative oxidoreductase/dehydrogenase [Rhodoglobus sp.]|nr:putative oxidoreductase/dehydrogenase [Rhodoglobus sp.]
MQKPVAVVTGAASGIGLALSRALVDAGYRVALADVRVEPLRAARDGILKDAPSAELLDVVSDVTSAESVVALAETVVREWGAVDLVINNAGVIGPVSTTWSGPLEQWHLAVDINFWGVLHGMRAFLPGMIERDSGRLVNVASVAAWSSAPQMGSYGATKHAVMALTESAYRELAELGSKVALSVVCPTTVRTGLVTHLEGTESAGEAKLLAARERGLQPEEVAALVLEGIAAGDYLITTDRAWLVNAAKQRLGVAEGGEPPLDREPPR